MNAQIEKNAIKNLRNTEAKITDDTYELTFLVAFKE